MPLNGNLSLKGTTMTRQKSANTRTKGTPCGESLQDTYQGTAALYVIGPDGSVESFIGDYVAEATRETRPSQIRATRQYRQRAGRAVSKLPRASLRDQVLITFEPLVAPEQAVTALEQAIASITKDGLLIGSDNQGAVAQEQIDGSVNV